MRAHEGRCLDAEDCHRQAGARADEAATTRVDELIQLGRGQGHLSLPELRAAFGEAGVSPAEGRSIIRELAEAGVRLGDEPAGRCPGGHG